MPATPEQRASPYNGYHRVSEAREDPELTHTGPHTPCGEYFRRFWMPVAMSAQVGKHALVVKVLGEELVLFRDRSGRLGLLHKHCSHRRASLEYGIVAERGIRCCYHGWLFDVDGTILEVPGEPEGSPIPRASATAPTRCASSRASSSPTSGHPKCSPSFPCSTHSRCPETSSSPTPSTIPATGCRWPRTRWTPSTASSCTPE